VTEKASMRARMQRFEEALRERGLKSTSQRDDIAQVFFTAEAHLSVEDLYASVRKVNPRVGYATVYRTLKLLKDVGLATERHFDDGQARYEATEDEEQHHDHIICERCHKIVEFNSETLEQLQERIARFLGFVVSRHRMELYGVCGECRGTGSTAEKSPRRRRGVQQV
jgi:Fur family transcriptional regulator, ferric uptake regulator